MLSGNKEIESSAESAAWGHHLLWSSGEMGRALLMVGVETIYELCWC